MSCLFRNYLVALPFTLLPLFVLCQTNITGQIKNASAPLDNVSVVVYDKDAIVAYTFTDQEGFYSIRLDNSERETLKIVANLLGYESQEKLLQLKITETNTVNFTLVEKAETLNEVVLEAWEKINVKRDTITFKASAFKDGSEQVVEDVLKNIPGIEVSNDGNIKVNGKAIDKLLIEGDDLFDDKYKLLTKNLDAETIKDVQILNNFEDNPVLKSFQESEKVALNLILKEDKKNVLFGNIDAGFGTNEQYDNLLNLGLLNRKVKFFNLAKLNNIGTTSLSQVKNTGNVIISGVKNEKKIEKRNNEVVNIDNLSSSNFSKNEDLFNTSFLNSLSFTTNIFKNTKLRSLSYIVLDDIDKQNSSFTEYFIEPETIYFNEYNNISIKDIEFATELELKHLTKNNTYYTYNFSFENNTAKKNGNLIFNDNFIYQRQKNNKHNFFNHLNVTKKISENKLLLLYTYLGINNTMQRLNIEPNIFEDVFENTDSTGLRQTSSSPLNYYGIITELIGKNKKSDYALELVAKVDQDKLSSAFNFYNESIIDSLSNKTAFKKTEFSVSGKYNFSITNNLKLGARIEVADNLLTLNEKKENLFSFQPSIRLNYKKNGLGSFGLNFSYNNSLPTIQYLNENYVLKNYRTFTRGSESIQQISNYNLSFIYAFANFKKQFLINSFLIYSFSDKSYGLRSNINENANFNQYEIIDGNNIVHYNLSVSKYLSIISSSIKFSTQQSWTNTPYIINDIESTNKNYTSSYRIQGTSYFNIPINFKYGLQYNYSKGIFNNNETNTDYLEWSLESTLKLSEEWLFKTENNSYIINGKNYFFTNISTNYNPEESRFSYRLIGNNLSNIKTFSNIYISDYQSNESSFQIIPRYILLNVKYRF